MPASVVVCRVDRRVQVLTMPVAPAGVWLLLAASLMMLVFPIKARGQNACPAGFNDSPALLFHLDQADIASGRYTFAQIFNFGRQLFVTNFNKCDGAGRPSNNAAVAVHGIGGPRIPDPFKGPRLTIFSGPDSNSCASCHNEPGVGGAGSFHANLFEQAVDCDPVVGVMFASSVFGNPNAQRPCRPTTPTSTGGGFAHAFNERGSLGMFGSGAIELLGREMTDDLLNLQAQAMALAAALQHDVSVQLITKGVGFGILTAHANGSLDTSGVQGVNPDLVIRPFGRKGGNKSLRHFTVQGFNRHLGMQPVEALEQLGPNPSHDPDQDGVSDELTVGDITAVVVFQAALPVPRRSWQAGQYEQVQRGEKLFDKAGCTGCHIPSLPLRSTVYCEPNPRNNDGDFRDTSQKFCFDLKQTSGLMSNRVYAYTDLKRHTICDPTRDYDPTTNHFCDDVPISQTPATDKTGPGAAGVTDRPPYYQFLTAKLWDAGNSGPWGHRNDLDTIYEAIIRHGGEATASVAAYTALSNPDQLAVVNFLKSLKMPIMQDNPQPQEADSPVAANPGDMDERQDGEFAQYRRGYRLGFNLALLCVAALAVGAGAIGRARRKQ